MATTDTKPGFRLPWSSDRGDPADAGAAAPGAADSETTQPQQEIETPDMIDAAPAATDHEAVVEMPAAPETTADPQAAVTPAATAAPQPAAARKPNKFMADLTKAMQTAAEAAREDALSRITADAKAYVEGIHATSATEAADLRKQADEDIAGVREWSKAEIARIREETDERIARRKATLEQEIEEHAAAIEARIERVQARVAAFETEMSAFFERLLAEDDPTRFAAMAESLPEPPPFDGPAPSRESSWAAPVAEAPVAEAPVEAPAAAAPAAAAPAEFDVVETTAEAPVGEAPVEETAAEPPAEETAAEAPADEPAGVDDSGLFGIGVDDTTDPRVSALGLTPDFAAAEAEAASFTTTDDGSEEAIPEIGDDAIAARLAGLVHESEAAPAAPIATTRVIVTGLISVASIAGFKRHLSRAAGVQSVGVSSGPDGEFVFAVGHATDVALRDVIPTLPGFAARITAESDGELTVAAQDPEAES